MNKHNWSDFAQAWKSMEELKEELRKTDLKLQNASMPFSNVQQKPSNPLTHSDTNISASNDDYLAERKWRKRKIYSRLKGSHLFSKFQFEDLMPDPNDCQTSTYHLEDHPKMFHRSPLNKNISIDTSKYNSSTLQRNPDNAFSRQSYKISELQIPSVPKSNLISREVLRSSNTERRETPSEVRFSKWEKEYLRKEVPDVQFSDTNSTLKDQSETLVKQPYNYPISISYPTNARTQKLAWQAERLQNCDGMKKLKELIEKQRERNDYILSEAQNDPFLNESASNTGEKDIPIKVPTDIRLETAISMKDPAINSSIRTMTKINRKTAIVQPPTVYKGFSPVKDFASTSPARLISSKILSPRQERAGTSKGWKLREKISVPPCVILNDPIDSLLRTSLEKRDDSVDDAEVNPDLPNIESKLTDIKTSGSSTPENSKSFSMHTQEVSKTSGTPIQKISRTSTDENIQTLQGSTLSDIATSPEIVIEPNVSEKEADELISSPLKNTSEDKENDLPSPDQHLIKVQKILKQMMDDNDDKCISPVSQPRQNKKIPTSKKRKAPKQPEPNQPAAKIRHYNPDAVRAYILKKKATRKKQEQEEKLSKLKAEQERKERLQQLYEYQKIAAKSVPKSKTTQPLKTVQENVILDKTHDVKAKVISSAASPKKSRSASSCHELPTSDKESKDEVDRTSPKEKSEEENVSGGSGPSKEKQTPNGTDTPDTEDTKNNVLSEENISFVPIDSDATSKKVINISQEALLVEDKLPLTANKDSSVLNQNSSPVVDVIVEDFNANLDVLVKPTSSNDQQKHLASPPSLPRKQVFDSSQLKSPSSSASKLSLHELLPKALDSVKKRLSLNSLQDLSSSRTSDQATSRDVSDLKMTMSEDYDDKLSNNADCAKISLSEDLDVLALKEGPLDTLNNSHIQIQKRPDYHCPVVNIATIPSSEFVNITKLKGSHLPKPQDILLEGPLESLHRMVEGPLESLHRMVEEPSECLHRMVEGPLESLHRMVEKISIEVPIPEQTKAKRNLKWDFDKLRQYTPNPYNFINTFQRKPLVLNQPVSYITEDEDRNVTIETTPSSIHISEVDSKVSYSSNFSEPDVRSDTTEFSEESRKVTKVSRKVSESFVPEEAVSMVSNGESTTISSVISTDTEDPVMARPDSSSHFSEISESLEQKQQSEIKDISDTVDTSSGTSVDESNDKTLTESLVEEQTSEKHLVNSKTSSAATNIEKIFTEESVANSHTSSHNNSANEKVSEKIQGSSVSSNTITSSKHGSNEEVLEEKSLISEKTQKSSVTSNITTDDKRSSNGAVFVEEGILNEGTQKSSVSSYVVTGTNETSNGKEASLKAEDTSNSIIYSDIEETLKSGPLSSETSNNVSEVVKSYHSDISSKKDRSSLSKVITSGPMSSKDVITTASSKSYVKSIESVSETTQATSSATPVYKIDSTREPSVSENVSSQETDKPIITLADNSLLQNYPLVHALIEPRIDPHSVTRVVAEAASAAATSAVIAALEYQKLLPTKKHLIEIMERRGASSSNREYSSDFESGKESFSVTGSSQQPPSFVKSDEGSVLISEQSVGEEVKESIGDTTLLNSSAGSNILSIPEASFQTSDNEKSVPSASSVQEELVMRVPKTRKQSENASSPSPASLSDNESLRSTSINTTASSASNASALSDNVEKLLSKDPFDQLTLDMVKQRSLEDERRARQQLSLLECQEKALVENVRAEMKWLELLKKKLKEKKATDKLPVVIRRQEELLLRLRQERAQLRCLKETYRSVTYSRHSLQTEKKKLLTDISDPDSQLFKKDSLSITIDKASGKGSPSLSISEASDISVATGNQSIIEESRSPVEEIPEAALSSSSAGSVAESPSLSVLKTSTNSFSKHSRSLSIPSRSSKGDLLMPQSTQSNYSIESVLQGMKRLDANKRYLTKKEQRLHQRRSRVESLMHWQSKLNQEEKDVKQLEKQAIAIIERNKAKSKYYVSASSPSSPINRDGDNFDGQSMRTATSREAPSIITMATSATCKEGSVSGSSAIEDAVVTAGEQDSSDNTAVASNISTAKASFAESSIDDNAASIVSEDIGLKLSGSSVLAEEINASSQSFINSDKSSLNGTTYSGSFASSTPTPAEISNAQKSNATSAQKKRPGTAGFMTGRHRRQDSSGSDDSFTISQSETASDQSDIEGRIHALTEELRRRKTEADKLRGEHKKQRCDQLKERENSLKKQLEAYDKFILDTKLELDQQLEAVNSADTSLLTPVKPQIKQPRVAKSRHLQKQPSIVSTSSGESKNSATSESDDPVTKEVSLLSNERKQQSTSHLAKKLRAIETKEVSDKASTQSSSTQSSSTQSSSIPSIVQKVPSSASIETELSSHSNVSTEKNTESDRESVAVPSGSSENSLSYSSDFATSDENVTPKEDVIKTQDQESHLGGNKSDVSSVKELLETPPLADDSVESSLERSDMSAIPSVDTIKQSPNHSSDADTFESSSTVDEDEQIESEKCDGPNGCSTPPLKINLDETFIINKSSCSEDEQPEIPSLDGELIPLEGNESISKEDSEAIEKLLEDLLDIICEDTVASICSSIEACRSTDPTKSDFESENCESKEISLVSLSLVHEEVANQIAEEVMLSLIRDTATNVLSIFRKWNSTQQLEEVNIDLAEDLQTSSTSTFTDHNEEDLPQKNESSELPEDTPSAPNIQAISSQNASLDQPSQSEKSSSVHQDWFADDLFLPRNKSSLPPIDQQLLVRQYPYYYRQIPNKPPPPYTPPSSPLPQSVQADPFKQDIEVEEKKSNVIEDVTKELDSEVEDCLTVLIQGKEQGLKLDEIVSPYCYENETESTVKDQLIFRSFLFQLTKETLTRLYAEYEGENKSKPWLRNQRLTFKPVLSLDLDVIQPNVLTEVRKLLNLEPKSSKSNLSMWSSMKLGRKKRDFVDTVIIDELKDEEADWVNYDEDEFQVKLQLTDSIFDVLKKDALEVFTNAASNYSHASS